MFQPQPQVVGTSPLGFSENIDTNQAIEIHFNTDINRDHIRESFVIVDMNNIVMETQISYQNRVVTLKPVPHLIPAMRYTVRVIGGKDGQGHILGIRSILNEPMQVDFSFQFNTVAVNLLKAPNAIFPPSQTIIQQQPKFSWSAVEDAASYQIRVSNSSRLIPVLWPTDSEVTTFPSTGPVTPGYSFPDGTYYWAIRSVAVNGIPGEWSPVYSFSKDTSIQGAQAPGDVVAPDAVPFYEEPTTQTLDIIESFPTDGQTTVAETLRSMYVRLSGQYTSTNITPAMITLTGENIMGIPQDPDYPSHGNVLFTLTVLPQTDGTTILKITPNV